MKRILIISYEFPPVVGGAGSVARDLARGLARECQVEVVTEWLSDEESSVRRDEGYTLHEVRSRRGLRPLNYWNCIRNLDLDGFHRIIINDARASMVGALFFDEKLLSKTVVYIHGREPEEIIKNPGVLRSALRYPARYERFLKRARRIVAVSRYMKEKLLETGIGIEDGMIDVVHNGISQEVFFPVESRVREEYGISPEKVLLVSVSRIVREKGYGQMAEIFKRAAGEDPDLHWLVAGDGAYLEELKEIIGAEGLEERVTFTGAVKREELPPIYSAGDLYWLLSNFDEALGLTYLEARFCGTPALARNKSGERETIEEGLTGHLADDDGDALNYILKREYLKLKETALRVGGYRMEDSITKMKEVLEF